MRKKMAMLLAMVTLVTTAGCGGSGEGEIHLPKQTMETKEQTER